MRGRGGDPNRVVDYSRFAGQFGGNTQQMSSQQPAGPTNPISAAPSSPMVGTGDVATAPSSFPTTTPQVGTVGEAGSSFGQVGDTPQQAINAAATPTYGPMSVGVMTNSNKMRG